MLSPGPEGLDCLDVHGKDPACKDVGEDCEELGGCHDIHVDFDDNAVWMGELGNALYERAGIEMVVACVAGLRSSGVCENCQKGVVIVLAAERVGSRARPSGYS